MYPIVSCNLRIFALICFLHFLDFVLNLGLWDVAASVKSKVIPHHFDQMVIICGKKHVYNLKECLEEWRHRKVSV